MNKVNYQSAMEKKDISEGGITLTLMDTKGDKEIFAVPGGGRIEGRENAIHAARCLIRSNPQMKKSPLAKLADKTVNRMKSASRDGGHVTMGF
jgi:hypothetical protein